MPPFDGNAPDPLTRRSFAIEVRAASINEGDRSVDVIVSTDALDAYEEVVEQDWNLRRYKNNPVVLWNHGKVGILGPDDAEDTLPIGSAKNVRVVDGHLEATLCFVDEKASSLAPKVWEGIKQGSIRAVSAGFMPGAVRFEKRDGGEIAILGKNELFEISVCPMGANPDAVAKSVTAERERLRAIATKTNAAERRAENHMDEIETLKASHEKAVADLTATHATALATVEKALGEERAAHEKTKAELAEKSAALEVTEKAAAEVREKALIAEVDGLVGKKIAPAQRDAMLDLAKSNKAAFDAVVAGAPDLTTLGKGVTQPAQTKSTAGDAPSASAEIADDLVAATSPKPPRA